MAASEALARLKAATRWMWTHGDYSAVASLLEPYSRQLADACKIQAGSRSLDVAAGTLTLPTGRAVNFPLEAFARHCLLEGVDELGYLLSRAGEIEAYERRA